MKKYLLVFLSSIMAGCFITCGATVYLVCTNMTSDPALAPLYKIIGSFMFGIGLFTIIHFGFWLYTGKVGYLLDNKWDYVLKVVLCFIGNFVGSFVLSKLISLTSLGDTLKTVCEPIVNKKLDSTWYSIFIMSMLCGVMIYLAVEGHKRCPYALGKVLFAFMPISLFILAGFEHVVANVTYFTYASIFSAKAFGYFVLMFFGNALGSLIFDAALKGIKWLEKDKNVEETIETKDDTKTE